jgi:hypothetical protein
LPAIEPLPDAPADDCALMTDPGQPVATVALTEPVDPANAPRPANDSERLLFRQLYETLVRVDCSGRVRPGLAASWRLDANGTSWIVTLRDNARFSDGTPLAAADVRVVWSRTGADGELLPHVSRLLQSVAVVDDRTLAITLRRARADMPLALAHTDLAVARPAPGSRWPLGTRSARIVAEQTASGGAAESSEITVARDDQPPLRFVVASRDRRDVLDDGVDLLMTRDAAALDYATTLSQYQLVAQAWDRTHVLLLPGRSPAAPFLSADARQVLAADAVRGEARGAPEPFWWQGLSECHLPSTAPARPSPAPQVVYDAGDGAARDLAERVVGLARASSAAAVPFLDALLPDRPRRTFGRAAGLTGDALVRARRLGADAGYLMAVNSRPLDPCRELQLLVDGAPWADPETIVPLVQTRRQAIVRRGHSGVSVEWDGGLLLAPAGRQDAR